MCLLRLHLQTGKSGEGLTLVSSKELQEDGRGLMAGIFN